MNLKTLVNFIVPFIALGIAILTLNEKSSDIYYSISETSMSIPDALENNKIVDVLKANNIPNHIVNITITNAGNTSEEELKLKINLNKIALNVSTQPNRSENPIFVEIDSLTQDSTCIFLVLQKFNINKPFNIRIGAITNDPLIKDIEINSLSGETHCVDDIKQIKEWSCFDVLRIPILILIIWFVFMASNYFIRRYIKNRVRLKVKQDNLYIKKHKDSLNFEPQNYEIENYLIVVKYAEMRCVRLGLYDFQINIQIRANDKNMFLDSIILKNKEEFTGSMFKESKFIKLKKIVQSNDVSWMNGTCDEFYDILKSQFQSTAVCDINNHKIPADEQEHLILADRIETTQMMDGYEEMPSKNWSLEITYNTDKKIDIPLNFQINDYSRSVYK